MENNKITDVKDLKLDTYYILNRTNRILYWNGSKWMKPHKDIKGSYKGFVCLLDKQPNFKFAKEIFNKVEVK